ncbi:trimeric intracellular cation channel family protein [Frigidibacter sp.]|uniref:trimeric intracellular cation channel family protein n=1 Tax=Frigidibacter sp. TaxID=2586418 RepID=UPI002733AE24|nr:trimeric intracellular cation channel family protein [Frigidibacter sp.]MDP3342058.1 trimeric intracellular cation channel family protein [Frigidibacter sp.]
MLEAAGVAVFALTGALVAARKGMDPFGFILLATVTGAGGGTLRDLLLARTVWWVEAPLGVIICAGVALVAWTIAYLRPGRLDGWSAKRLLLWADAAGLALFAVSGTQKALAAGVPVLSAIALGAVTASFGGILRDILAGDRAMVLWSRDFYVTAAAAGATATALLTQLGFGPAIVMVGGLAAGFGLRAGSILLGWSFPRLPGSDEPR